MLRGVGLSVGGVAGLGSPNSWGGAADGEAADHPILKSEIRVLGLGREGLPNRFRVEGFRRSRSDNPGEASEGLG